MDLRAFIFVPAMVGAVILGFVFLLFLCHHYLTVLEATAAGAKEVPWVSEPITDHFWKLWYLGFLVVIWLAPAIAIGRVLTAGMDSQWVQLIGPLLVLWVCYPVSQLSSLSASSMWYPLVPDVFARMAQKPMMALQFLVLSGLVMALFGVAFQWTFRTKEQWELLFIGSPMLVFAVLFYARILGRFGFALRFTTGLFDIKRKKKPKPETESQPKPPPKEKPRPKRRQPRELPALESPEGEVTGYDVRFDDNPHPTPRKRVRAEAVDTMPEEEHASEEPSTPAVEDQQARHDDEDTSAYEVHEPEVQPEERLPAAVVTPSESERQLLSRSDTPKKPRRLWSSELFVFLRQPGTISAFLVSSGFCFTVGAMVRVARAYNPVDG